MTRHRGDIGIGGRVGQVQVFQVLHGVVKVDPRGPVDPLVKPWYRLSNAVQHVFTISEHRHRVALGRGALCSATEEHGVGVGKVGQAAKGVLLGRLGEDGCGGIEDAAHGSHHLVGIGGARGDEVFDLLCIC